MKAQSPVLHWDWHIRSTEHGPVTHPLHYDFKTNLHKSIVHNARFQHSHLENQDSILDPDFSEVA